MARKIFFAAILTVALPFANATVFGQCCDQGNGGDYGYGDCDGQSSEQSSETGSGLYSRNCGRGITTQQAVGLWGEYCSEDCGFQGGGQCGCGLFQGGHGGCFQGRHGCGLLKRLFGCGNRGCSTTLCDDNYSYADDGCDAAYVEQNTGGNGGCDSAVGGCAGHHGCRLLRGVFGHCGRAGLCRRQSGGCSCYQGCFGYPSSGGCGTGGYESGGCLTGSRGGHGCGCKIFQGLFGVARAAKSKTCFAVRGIGRLAGGLKQKLSCGCLSGHRLRGAGCTGYDGGYFYDAPITTSDQFGFYSSGCSSCDSAPVTLGTDNSIMNQPTIMNQPMQSNCDGSNCDAFSRAQPISTPVDLGSSFSPAGEILTGEVVGEGAGGN